MVPGFEKVICTNRTLDNARRRGYEVVPSGQEDRRRW